MQTTYKHPYSTKNSPLYYLKPIQLNNLKWATTSVNFTNGKPTYTTTINSSNFKPISPNFDETNWENTYTNLNYTTNSFIQYKTLLHTLNLINTL